MLAVTFLLMSTASCVSNTPSHRRNDITHAPIRSQAFLPLACTANLAKNLAAVAASSTRAPIYKTFAQNNNLVGALLLLAVWV